MLSALVEHAGTMPDKDEQAHVGAWPWSTQGDETIACPMEPDQGKIIWTQLLDLPQVLTHFSECPELHKVLNTKPLVLQVHEHLVRLHVNSVLPGNEPLYKACIFNNRGVSSVASVGICCRQ